MRNEDVFVGSIFWGGFFFEGGDYGDVVALFGESAHEAAGDDVVTAATGWENS